MGKSTKSISWTSKLCALDFWCMARYVHKFSHTPARLMACPRAPREGIQVKQPFLSTSTVLKHSQKMYLHLSDDVCGRKIARKVV